MSCGNIYYLPCIYLGFLTLECESPLRAGRPGGGQGEGGEQGYGGTGGRGAGGEAEKRRRAGEEERIPPLPKMLGQARRHSLNTHTRERETRRWREGAGREEAERER